MRKASQGGIAALEVVLVLPVFLLMLAGITLLGRFCWHYTVAQKAAHDSARYLATVSQRQILTPGFGGAMAPVTQIAQNIALLETAELHPGPYPPSAAVLCSPRPCNGFNVPGQVRIFVQMQMTDEIFTPITQLFQGQDSWLITADVSMDYVGI